MQAHPPGAIRPAIAADATAIAGLWNPLIRDTPVTFNTVEKSPAEVAGMIAARAAAGHAFLVAEGPDGLLGFASYSQFRAGPGYARTMEHTVILAPQARGRGIGRALMAALEDHARAGGVHSMFAGVSSGNPEGRAFHARIGYAEVATLRAVGWKFGQWLDLHLMQKMLENDACRPADTPVENR
jgi:L-amino acid N-acyltransferase